MQQHEKPLVGGIEAGGTKFVCAVGTGPGDLRATARIPTTTPGETLARVAGFFKDQPDPVTALGIGSFGPVDVDPGSPTFGYITSTPKPGWAQTDFAGTIRRALGVPVAFDTDVNAAALAESLWGAATHVRTFLYVTVGTGIGGGAFVEGRPLHGLVHPEIGHLTVPRAPDDTFEGICPFHGDCLEGLASGPALRARWGQSAETLAPDHPGWTLEAHYLAHALVSAIYVLSPERIVLGGGVMQQTHLFPLIRRRVREILNGYIQAEALLTGIDSFIVPSPLEGRAGILGALAMAYGPGVNG